MASAQYGAWYLIQALAVFLICSVQVGQCAYFSEPPNFNVTIDGRLVQIADLSTTYVMNQTVRISWQIPEVRVDNITLSLHRWENKDAVGVFLS
jgi:hypothetical protein